MSQEFPSLLGFQPKFYLGGPARFHLPFAYDLVATGKPKTVVTLGFGDGELHFACCQAARESRISCRLLALRSSTETDPKDDNAWQVGLDYNREFYGDISNLLEDAPVAATKSVADGSIDLLFLNDCDSHAVARRLWDVWAQKISPDGVVVVHGIGTKREHGIAEFWGETKDDATSAEFSTGIGLGVTSKGKTTSPILKRLFDQADRSGIELLYQLAAARIESQARAERIAREDRMLQLRQVWIPTLLDDRIQMQYTIDHLNRHLAHFERVHASTEAELRQQLVALEASLQQKEKEIKRLTGSESELKKRLAESKRKPVQPSDKRSVPEKIAREIQRIPKNLSKILKTEPAKKKRNRGQ